jgi:signal transduction histidine kinase
MKIKTKLTANFLLLVAGIMLFFSASVYIVSMTHRQDNFAFRLKNKAINTAILLLKVNEVSTTLLKTIDDSTLSTLSDVSVIILDSSNHILYSNRDSLGAIHALSPFKKLDKKTDGQFFENNWLYLKFNYKFKNQNYLVLASAFDQYGLAELKDLRKILIIAFVLSLALTIVAGYINARQSLRPIKDVIFQVDNIKAHNLKQRLDIRNRDEIAELSVTFNKMLDRIEQAFETERMFVSNASHELRTPVTVIIGQLEVALMKKRNDAEYKDILLSVLDEVRDMKNIINDFLDLAEASKANSSGKFSPVRIDELLFTVRDEILRHKPEYLIDIDFEEYPEDEKEISVMGSENLLRIMISNIIDNACKFSKPHRVMIKIGCRDQKVYLRFVDNGIGIPETELQHVFEPLFRAQNTSGKTGHGIGLSLVKRIANIHQANIEISSKLNVGTSVTLTFTSVDRK